MAGLQSISKKNLRFRVIDNFDVLIPNFGTSRSRNGEVLPSMQKKKFESSFKNLNFDLLCFDKIFIALQMKF